MLYLLDKDGSAKAYHAFYQNLHLEQLSVNEDKTVISPLGVARAQDRKMEKYSDLTTWGGARTRQEMEKYSDLTTWGGARTRQDNGKIQ